MLEKKYVKIENTMRECRYHLPVKADRVRIAGSFFSYYIGKDIYKTFLLFTCSTDNNELKKNQFAYTILVCWQFSTKSVDNYFNEFGFSAKL